APLFPVSSKIQPTTHGADVWDTPVCTYYSRVTEDYTIHPIDPTPSDSASMCGEDSPAILFIDTEGTESYETDSAFDQSMHSLAHLLADVVVVNVAWPYQFDIGHTRELQSFTDKFGDAYLQHSPTAPSVLYTVQKSDMGGDGYMERIIAAVSAYGVSTGPDPMTPSAPPSVLGIPVPLESRQAWLTMGSLSLSDMTPGYQQGVAEAVDTLGAMLHDRHTIHTPRTGSALANDMLDLLDALAAHFLHTQDVATRINESGVTHYTQVLMSAAEATLSPLLPLSEERLREVYTVVMEETPCPGSVREDQKSQIESDVLASVEYLNAEKCVEGCRDVLVQVEDCLNGWRSSGFGRRFGMKHFRSELMSLPPCMGVLSTEVSQSIDMALQEIKGAQVADLILRYSPIVTLLGTLALGIFYLLPGPEGDTSEYEDEDECDVLQSLDESQDDQDETPTQDPACKDEETTSLSGGVSVGAILSDGVKAPDTVG
ncbi:hypothetical protein KIPB_008922, partial [Kipferlia bialata]